MLAGGLDRLYLAGNRDLLELVGDWGLLVSKMVPGLASTQSRSLTRNHLLATLAGATVVVVAGYRSGALDVAGQAARLGRPIGAVPCPVTSAASFGTLRLLRNDVASMITEVEDINKLLDPSSGNTGHDFGRKAGIADPAARAGRSL